MEKKSPYSRLIQDAVNCRIVHDFAFGYLRFEWVYAYPYVTIVDRITQLYLEACDGELSKYKDSFDLLRGWMRFEYGTPYIANYLYRLYEFYEFEYDVCMKCEESGTYCEMDHNDVIACMERAEAKHWADLAAPSWDDD
jgi:hypothetical protein